MATSPIHPKDLSLDPSKLAKNPSDSPNCVATPMAISPKKASDDNPFAAPRARRNRFVIEKALAKYESERESTGSVEDDGQLPPAYIENGPRFSRNSCLPTAPPPVCLAPASEPASPRDKQARIHAARERASHSQPSEDEETDSTAEISASGAVLNPDVNPSSYLRAPNSSTSGGDSPDGATMAAVESHQAGLAKSLSTIDRTADEMIRVSMAERAAEESEEQLASPPLAKPSSDKGSGGNGSGSRARGMSLRNMLGALSPRGIKSS